MLVVKLMVLCLFHCSRHLIILKVNLSLYRPGPAPGGSTRFRLPEFIDNWHMKLARCQPHASAAFTADKYSWYSFPLKDESPQKP